MRLGEKNQIKILVLQANRTGADIAKSLEKPSTDTFRENTTDHWWQSAASLK